MGICLCLAAPPLLSIFGRPFSYKCSQCQLPWAAAPDHAKQWTKLNFSSLLAFPAPACFWIAAGETDEALFASCLGVLRRGKAGCWDCALAGLWRHYSPSFCPSLGLSDSLHSLRGTEVGLCHSWKLGLCWGWGACTGILPVFCGWEESFRALLLQFVHQTQLSRTRNRREKGLFASPAFLPGVGRCRGDTVLQQEPWQSLTNSAHRLAAWEDLKVTEIRLGS